jgi:hypothetical protein
MLAGWSAIAAAILTVTGLITLLAFFGTGSALLGALNDLNTIAMALVTVPVALALYPVASRTSGSLATIALGPTSSAWCWLPASAPSWSWGS